MKKKLLLLITMLTQNVSGSTHSWRKDHYEKYKNFIKKIDEDVYESIVKSEKELRHSSLIVTDACTSRIFEPTKKTHGYPTILLEKEMPIPEGEEYLKCKLRNLIFLYNRFYKEFYNLNLSRTTAFKSIVKKASTDIYIKLLSLPDCFKIAGLAYKGPMIVASSPYPFLVLSEEKWSSMSEDEFMSHINQWDSVYEKISKPLTAERLHFLNIIQSLAPELYKKIKRIDPSGEKHITKKEDDEENASVSFSSTGLPVISVGKKIVEMPLDLQYFIIAHELGHYALGHLKSTKKLIHKELSKASTSPEYAPQKKVREQLLFEEAFSNTASRINEYEADRFSIVTLGTSPEAAIQFHERCKASKKTFLRTHPLPIARINNCKAIEEELELAKAHGGTVPAIDWDAIIERYKNNR